MHHHDHFFAFNWSWSGEEFFLCSWINSSDAASMLSIKNGRTRFFWSKPILEIDTVFFLRYQLLLLLLSAISLLHTHKHTHTHTLTLSLTHPHIHPHTQSINLSISHPPPPPHTLSDPLYLSPHTYTYFLTNIRPHTHSTNPPTQKYSESNSFSHTQPTPTRAYTPTRSLSLSQSNNTFSLSPIDASHLKDWSIWLCFIIVKFLVLERRKSI